MTEKEKREMIIAGIDSEMERDENEAERVADQMSTIFDRNFPRAKFSSIDRGFFLEDIYNRLMFLDKEVDKDFAELRKMGKAIQEKQKKMTNNEMLEYQKNDPYTLI